MKEMLNIVDENGMILGEASREEIHKKGLLHREVHVWLYTPDGKVIFQRRAMTKDTFPGLLDASVGGHVELGMDFADTALKELEEETGIKAMAEDLIYLDQSHTTAHDPVTGTINNALRRSYAFCYRGEPETLRVEDGAGAGFEVWPIDKLLNISDGDRGRFIPMMFDETRLALYRKMMQL